MSTEHEAMHNWKVKHKLTLNHPEYCVVPKKWLIDLGFELKFPKNPDWYIIRASGGVIEYHLSGTLYIHGGLGRPADYAYLYETSDPEKIKAILSALT